MYTCMCIYTYIDTLVYINCKIMAIVMKWDVLDHLLLHNLNSKQQHDLVSNCATCTQLLETLNDWTAALDNKKSCDVYNVDFNIK